MALYLPALSQRFHASLLDCSSNQNLSPFPYPMPPDTSQPITIHHALIRRSRFLQRWFTTNKECTDAVEIFTCGIAQDVTFNNRAIPMCFRGQDTFSDALCKTLDFHRSSNGRFFTAPATITYMEPIFYSPSKGGLLTRESRYLVKHCDVLLLQPDGVATCCWFDKPADMH